MARLNMATRRANDSEDEEFPDLKDLLASVGTSQSTQTSKDHAHPPTKSKITRNESKDDIHVTAHPSIPFSPGQRAAKLLSVREVRGRETPKRAAKTRVDYSSFAKRDSDGSPSLSEDEGSSTDLSGFIVSDSASEDELKVPNKSPRKRLVRAINDLSTRKGRGSLGGEKASPEKVNYEGLDVTVRLPPQLSNTRAGTNSFQDPARLDGGLENPLSNLKISSPGAKKPHKLQKEEREVTPPSSPSKSILLSPSKRNRIPPSPHRPSIDLFWSQDVINEWNDQYSPQKPPKTPNRTRLFSVREENGDSSPSASPRKSPSKSPTKRDKESVARRKSFEQKKESIAQGFLNKLDHSVTDGQLSSLAASTGGIQIIWSKKLSSTAGRAHWRREALRRKQSGEDPASMDAPITHRHHASIELAEKIINEKDRLFNTLAHEFCHLATYMISGVKDQPHGAEFKRWAARCGQMFGISHGVCVTTKHSYEIEYKYIWMCTQPGCALEYRRHSKSIDPAKHACGKCKGKLEQIRPAPRKESEYQKYVKANWDRVKGEMTTAGMNGGGTDVVGMGEVMAALAKEFKQRQRQNEKQTQDQSSSSPEKKKKEKETERKKSLPLSLSLSTSLSTSTSTSSGSDDLDNVASKLKSLTLDLDPDRGPDRDSSERG